MLPPQLASQDATISIAARHIGSPSSGQRVRTRNYESESAKSRSQALQCTDPRSVKAKAALAVGVSLGEDRDVGWWSTGAITARRSRRSCRAFAEAVRADRAALLG